MIIYFATEIQSIMGKNLTKKSAKNRLISYSSILRDNKFTYFSKYLKKGKP